MPLSIAATVITYNPKEDLLSNILTYYKFVQTIIVIDNSDFQTNQISNLEQYEKIIVIKNKSNFGISKALNIAAEYAINLKYDWLLTMDQDSKFDESQIKNYINCFENIKKVNIGMIGVQYFKHKVTNSLECNFTESNTLITSGSLLNLESFIKLGGFNENLFIDGVDEEFCLRLILNNYRIIQFNNILLDHSLGKNVLVRNWYIGPLVERNLHTPIRMYYIIRNYLFLIKNFQKEFPEKIKEYEKIIHLNIKYGILYNKRRMEVLKFIIKAYIDFKKNKMGKYSKY